MQFIKLWQLHFQKKSKRKAWEWQGSGSYKFFTSSQVQKKYVNEYDFSGPALVFGTGWSASIHYCDEQFSTSTDCFILKTENDQVDLKYVSYFLKWNISLLENGFKWAWLEHISKEYLSEIQIPLPSLEIQKFIVTKLSKLTELIDLKKETIAKAEELTKSIFLEMFGDPMINQKQWDLSSIEKICERIVDCPHSTAIFETQWKYCVDTTCIKPGFIDLNKIRLVSTDTFRERNIRTPPKAWDVLFSREWALLWVAVVIPDWLDLCLGQRIMLFRLNHSLILSKYFEYVLNSDSFKLSYKWKIWWSASPHLNISDIRKLNILVPPLLLQKKFSEIVQKNQIIIEDQKQSLQKIQELYDTTIQNIFNF